MRIAIVAGELSGDFLGAGLMVALRKHYPNACFEGIGGKRMLAQGFNSLFPLEKLSVMGLIEVLRHLPELLQVRRTLQQRFLTDPPAVFIGIDAPDFNLTLERRLRAAGIPTVHYVSPQIWAWRQKRVRKIARSVDLMLTLLPFEAAFYRDHQVPVRYVGHPLADEIPLKSDPVRARQALGLATTAEASRSPLLALLPGSRMSEVQALGPVFVDTAVWLQTQRPQLGFIMPVATIRIRQYMLATLGARAPDLPITLVEGQSREAMTAADAVLLASGTATLEALLLKRPMVVAYKVAPLTAWIAARLLKISYFSLPNLLAGRELVREFFQSSVTPDKLGPALLALLDDPGMCSRLQAEFTMIHHQLCCNANVRAAAAIAELLD